MMDVETRVLDQQPEWWAVLRIDDNGNTFVVSEHLDHAEAERLVNELTARGHKQLYWAEQQAMDGKPDTVNDGRA